MLADDFAHEMIKEATELKQGEFIFVRWENKIKVATKMRIF